MWRTHKCCLFLNNDTCFNKDCSWLLLDGGPGAGRLDLLLDSSCLHDSAVHQFTQNSQTVSLEKSSTIGISTWGTLGRYVASYLVALATRDEDLDRSIDRFILESKHVPSNIEYTSLSTLFYVTREPKRSRERRDLPPTTRDQYIRRREQS